MPEANTRQPRRGARARPGTLPGMPPSPAGVGVAWTPEEAAAAHAPYADAGILRAVVAALGLPEVAPGRWDAADLGGLHVALGPWLPSRRMLRAGRSEDASGSPAAAPRDPLVMP